MIETLTLYAKKALGIRDHDHPDCAMCQRHHFLADFEPFPTELEEPMTTLWEWEDEQRKLKGPKE